MSGDKIRCRECGLCDVEKEECTQTGRKVTLDSLRKCKRGFRKELIEQKG
jgi:hypothetical protein